MAILIFFVHVLV